MECHSPRITREKKKRPLSAKTTDGEGNARGAGPGTFLYRDAKDFKKEKKPRVAIFGERSETRASRTNLETVSFRLSRYHGIQLISDGFIDRRR